MAGSNTQRVQQANTFKYTSNVNNQDLSKDITSRTTQNVRNHDIVHGDDIKGGMNTFNALSNTGKQIFKLQELMYTTGPVITTHTSDVSMDSTSNVQQSGSRSGSSTSDSTQTVSSTCTAGRYVDYTHRYFTASELSYLNNTIVPNMLRDPCMPAAQKAGYREQLAIINQKFGWVSGVY